LRFADLGGIEGGKSFVAVVGMSALQSLQTWHAGVLVLGINGVDSE